MLVHLSKRVIISSGWLLSGLYWYLVIA